jgi:uncharacterized protein YkwD
MRRALLVLAICAACGGGAKAGRGASGDDGRAGAGADGDVEQHTVVERMPDGTIKKTTITTTRRVVAAPPPPPRPADPWPSDPRIKYNVDRINAYRAQHGLAALLYDAKISAFARAGSERLARDHTPHANFAEHAEGAPGFGSVSAENQGDPSGVPPMDGGAKRQIDAMLDLMMKEGPGGGHYENMMSPRFRRVGVGLVDATGDAGPRLYMTNDFSD